MNVLIVRLGAMGDIVHAIPAAAAIRAAMPDARIDWVVDAKHQEVLHLVTVLDRVVPLEGRSVAAWSDAVRRLRQVSYDIALDFQGLMKSAVLARASGASRVAGFSIWHLREKGARPFYSETSGHARSPAEAHEPHGREGGRSLAEAGEPGAREGGGHVIQKNLDLLRVLGIETSRIDFPIARVMSNAADALRARFDGDRFALINPGAAWPNKRWPADRFGAVAAFLRDVRSMRSIVLWGPGEEALAADVVARSSGAAELAPPTGIHDIFEVARSAELMISGDSGPLHIAAAVGTPTVAIFGPTDPCRNGPWSTEDRVVSRYDACACHYDRRCHERDWCLQSITVAEVTAAIQQRHGRAMGNGPGAMGNG
jgi:lipopolysaccharide heptosyltransferase I